MLVSRCLFSVVLAFLGGVATAQSLNSQVNPELGVPVGDSASVWNLGGGAETQWHLALPPGVPILSHVEPYLSAGYRLFPNDSGKTLGLISAGLGFEYQEFFTDRWGGGLSASGGLFQASYSGITASNLFYQAGANVKFRLTPALQLGLGASWQGFQGTTAPLVNALAVQLNLQLGWDGFQSAGKLAATKLQLDPVFPVLYSQYDKHELGSIELTNGESGEVRNLRVSFYVKQFMERPKECATVDVLPRGGSVNLPLAALFTSDVLKLIESTKVLAEVSVDYDFLGTPRHQTFESPLRVYNRNAMSWDDDRKASAFVSSKDPGVLRYSKFVTGLLRNQGLQGISQNLKAGIGLWECLKLLGINYVVDPTTPYTEFSTNTASVDFLQFPYETLTYKGGDCDDLSILFASILQSVGIRTAFITVPGHIYAAFALDLGPKEAQALFANLDDLIPANGALWVPVEITLLSSDFAKAWSYGAQEWREAGADARLYPMDESWKLYDPVSPPDQDTRITLPASQDVEKQINAGLAKFTDALLPPKLAQLQKDLATAASADKGKAWNRIGILYAKYGRLTEARSAFVTAGQSGFTLADTNLGNLALVQKDYPTAQSRFEKSQRANPTDLPTLLGLALTYYETERYAEAAAMYDKIAALDATQAARYSFLSKGGVKP